jgi:circadian clock protein KaiB
MIATRAKTHKQKAVNNAGDKYYLRLYIAGLTPKAVTALKNLRSICEEKLEGKYHIDICDILKHPQLGRKYQILAIPTLMRMQPHPVRLIIGDLSNTERLMAGLDIN